MDRRERSRDRGRPTVGQLTARRNSPLDRDAVYVDPTSTLIVLPDPCSIRGQAARAWLDHYLADNEAADGRLPHERTQTNLEAA